MAESLSPGWMHMEGLGSELAVVAPSCIQLHREENVLNPSIPPIILGSIFLVIGAISFWGRFKLSRFGAKASAAVNPNDGYDKAYDRRIRYGFISGLVFLLVGGGFFCYGVISFLMQAG